MRRRRARGPYCKQELTPLPPLAKALRQARREAGLTQQQLADRLGVTRVNYTRYERGSVAFPWRLKDKLHEALPASRDWPLRKDWTHSYSHYDGTLVWDDSRSSA